MHCVEQIKEIRGSELIAADADGVAPVLTLKDRINPLSFEPRRGDRRVSDVETYEMLILGSGEAGKYLTWTMAKAGHRSAMVERKWLGRSCPNVACLPSKNLIYSPQVASLSKRGAEFGLEMNSLAISMGF